MLNLALLFVYILDVLLAGLVVWSMFKNNDKTRMSDKEIIAFLALAGAFLLNALALYSTR